VAAVNEEYRAPRGFVYIRETAPGSIIVSFYPHSQGDPTWPGTIQAADDIDGFPKNAALRGDIDAVGAWVKQNHRWQ
jgi:hypothetical protein